jgi:hypothetical protein
VGSSSLVELCLFTWSLEKSNQKEWWDSQLPLGCSRNIPSLSIDKLDDIDVLQQEHPRERVSLARGRTGGVRSKKLNTWYPPSTYYF